MCVRVAEVSAQLGDQVHPFFKIQPLLPAQPATVLGGQVVDLVVIDLREFAVTDDELDLASDELVQRSTQIAGRFQDFLFVA